MKKVCSLLLVALMLLTALAGCKKSENPDDGGSGNNGDSVSSDSQTVETDEYGQEVVKDNVPTDLNYNGMEIVFATRHTDQYIREFGKENSSDALDARIFRRNKAIENTLNIKIKTTQDVSDDIWDSTKYAKMVESQYLAGADAGADVIAAYAAWAVTPTIRSYLVNLKDTSKMTYLDTTKSYWNQKYVEAATCFDQLYYLVGDVNLSVYDKSIVTFVNIGVADSLGYQINDLYQKVEDKEWTIDYFLEIVKNVTYIEQDGILGASAGDDGIALTTPAWSEGCDGFLAAFDFSLVKTEDDGTHTLNVSGNARLEDAVAKLNRLYSGDASASVFTSSSLAEVFNTFKNGRALFSIDILYRNADNNNALRNANFDYAVLPLPKYDDDEQTPYYTTPQDAYNTMSVINVRSERFAAISATLELMSSKSYSDVRPFYIEKVVKTRYVEGSKAVKMLEYIFDGVRFDVGTVYQGQFKYVNNTMFRDAIAKNTTVAVRWAKYGTETQTLLEEFDAWFMATKD